MITLKFCSYRVKMQAEGVSLAEPLPCGAFFSTTANGLHWLWGGDTKSCHLCSYDPQTELWTIHDTRLTPQTGEHSGGCTSVGAAMYMFGGYYLSTRNNDLCKLDLVSMEWSKAYPMNTPRECPMSKVGCGLVAVDEDTLFCFGGYGFGHTQAGSLFIQNSRTTDGLGHTNECHLFHIKKGSVYCMYTYM